MKTRFRPTAHGAFAFDFRPDYTLYRSSGSWNLEGAGIFDRVVRERIASVPDTRRCMIVDHRLWHFDTPDAAEAVKGTVRFTSAYYKELYIAHLFREEQLQLYKYVFDGIDSAAAAGRLNWRYFTNLDSAVEWLRNEGFSLPDLTDEDFPETIEAEEYLKKLGPPND